MQLFAGWWSDQNMSRVNIKGLSFTCKSGLWWLLFELYYFRYIKIMNNWNPLFLKPSLSSWSKSSMAWFKSTLYRPDKTHKKSPKYQILTQVWYGWSPQLIRAFTLMLQYLGQDQTQDQQYFLTTIILLIEFSIWLCLNLHSLLIYTSHTGILHPVE